MADPAPGTLGAMKARIARELARSNLTTQIGDAINDAIAIYAKERFRFSDITPSVPPTFNTVADRYIYTSADNPNISTLYNFDYVFANIGGSSVANLERDTAQRLKLYLQQQAIKGQPAWYAYEGNQLLIAPIPDQAYLITLGAFLNIPGPKDDAEEDNPWMTTAERLIRSRAKYEIALHVTRNPVMQDAMSPIAPLAGKTTGSAAYFAWKELKGEANRVVGRGKVRPMAF